MSKRKLIIPQQEFLVVCDNPKCDYTVENTLPFEELRAETYEKFLDKPCPKCGENLLTKEDFSLALKLINFVNFVNKYFGWLGTKKHEPKKGKLYSVKVHKGLTIQEEP